MHTHRKRLIAAFGAVAVITAGVGLTLSYGQKFWPASAAEGPVAAPAVDVDVAEVVHRPIIDWQTYSGRLQAVEQIDIRPQVSGAIVAVHVKDGGLVKKGDLLFTIDPQPYEAEVARAEALLAAAQTRAGYATNDAARAQQLLASSTIAQRTYDERQNAAREAAANVKGAKAALDAARINLAYTRIVAPVAGRVSQAELTVGNVVPAGAAAPLLATLVSVSPIYASFDVDEQTYLRHLRHASSSVIPAWLGLADEDGYSREGAVASIDNKLDIGSGTIRVRARFDNADGALVPGLYARIKLGGGMPRSAVLIGDAAVGTDQARKYVWVIDAQNRVRYREIRLGALQEGLRVVAAGLEPGERIVVGGLQRVRPNDVVQAHIVDMLGRAQTIASAN